MADTVQYSQDLKFEAMFVDGDTRTFSMKDPKSNISQSDISELNTYMQTNNVLIGDKYGGRFGKLTLATVVDKTIVNLDLDT